ncbi:EF-hand and coiled-coil domain-containing protein 1 isoform X2 [Petromyzon marinus]|uniref:EF-hand and coiled-coil domain-containing protein 1 isoform X2 n=1 Tax=Petromyzon marinus TaxID=7757 RepID=A0AAJ7TQI1_PETMA|nr:EF-hand and coiled-coil domain-containing protein 1 isoform X2 [Petromyzon marinus]
MRSLPGAGAIVASDPARREVALGRTQWLAGALALRFGLDRGVENEVAVLSTGLDQYLQETFHHLDYRGRGTVEAQDFRALCELIGVGGARGMKGEKQQQQQQQKQHEVHDGDAEGKERGEQDGDAKEKTKEEEEEARGVLEELPDEVSFEEFHARLCGFFSEKGGTVRDWGCFTLAPAGEERVHVEARVTRTGPLRRRMTTTTTAGITSSSTPTLSISTSGSSSSSSNRRINGSSSSSKVVSFDLEGSERLAKARTFPAPQRAARSSFAPSSSSSSSAFSSPAHCDGGRCCELVVSLEQLEDETEALRDENEALREIAEGMRCALQRSDARCLALHVALARSHGAHDGCFLARGHPEGETLAGNGTSEEAPMGATAGWPERRMVLRELELLRGSRDRQVAEAARFCRALESELRAARIAMSHVQERHCAQLARLQQEAAVAHGRWARERAETLRRAEEARRHLLAALALPGGERRAPVGSAGSAGSSEWRSGGGQRRREGVLGARPTSGSSSEVDVDGRTDDDVTSSECSLSCPSSVGVGEDRMARAVEGRASSDEEEGDPASGAQRKPLCCCGKGCDGAMPRRTGTEDGPAAGSAQGSSRSELRDRLEKLRNDLAEKESELKDLASDRDGTSVAEESPAWHGDESRVVAAAAAAAAASPAASSRESAERLLAELQLVEAERVRLSLVEETLVDVVTLLRQLRSRNISNRVLGRTLLDCLDSCKDSQQGPNQALEILNRFGLELQSRDLLTGMPIDVHCQPSSAAIARSC